jgi:4-hydroxybenzoate polyprenyltransferase
MSASTTLRPASPGILLRLGRVSNLPTVWTNVLAGTVIAGGDPLSARTALVVLAMTLFYVGGMYLNDAFDRVVDGHERPGRPIPSGAISARTVFAAGFGMLGLGTVLMAFHGLTPALAGLALGAAIVLCDLHHKGNPLSPVLMGICRSLVYVGAAAVVSGGISAAVLMAGLALLAHVAGLTYAAKQESLDRIDRLWPLGVLALPLMITLPALENGWSAVAAWALA